MKITKFGHSCLLVEEGEARIIIDPGIFSTGQSEAKNIDAVLITHEHQDHCDPQSLKEILVQNPSALVYGNENVCQVLSLENISVQLLRHRQIATVKGVLIEGEGHEHALIHPSIPIIPNVGYRIAERLFHPGDALTIPEKPVEILAYPAVAPWMKVSEALDYGMIIKPKTAFPIHDGFLKTPMAYHTLPQKLFTEHGIVWTVIEDGETVEF